MRERLLTGIPLALIILGLLLLDGHLSARPVPAVPWSLAGVELGQWLTHGAISAAIVLVLTVLATHELVVLARFRGYRPFGKTAVVFAAILALGPYVSFNLKTATGVYDESWALLWMAIGLGFMFLVQAVVHRTANAMENLAITIFIVFYAGGLAGFMTKLRMEVGGHTGIAVIIFSIFLVKMTDTWAYFTGRLLGRHKLIEWLSPKKTWEGLVGGLVATVLLAVLIGSWLHHSGIVPIPQRRMSYLWALGLLGLLLGVFSAAGDLCASLLKRDAAVKDSGSAFASLGGVLDVIDSLLLTAPVAWVFWTRLFPVGEAALPV